MSLPNAQLPNPRQGGKPPVNDMFKDLRAQLNSRSFRDRIAAGVPAEFRSVGYVDRLIESIFIACRDNPELLTKCDRASLFRAAERIAKRGLTVGNGVAWLVPYSGQVQDQLGYKGAMIEVRRSGQVKRITCQPVYEQDHCKIILGNEQLVEHETCLAMERGRCIGVYAIAWVDGDPEVEWMSAEEVEHIRMQAPSKNSPAWKTWWSEMARTKVLKRLCKRLPTERQIDLDDMDERNSREIEGSAEVINFDEAMPRQQPNAIQHQDHGPDITPAFDPQTGEIEEEPEPIELAQPAPQPAPRATGQVPPPRRAGRQTSAFEEE